MEIPGANSGLEFDFFLLDQLHFSGTGQYGPLFGALSNGVDAGGDVPEASQVMAAGLLGGLALLRRARRS